MNEQSTGYSFHWPKPPLDRLVWPAGFDPLWFRGGSHRAYCYTKRHLVYDMQLFLGCGRKRAVRALVDGLRRGWFKRHGRRYYVLKSFMNIMVDRLTGKLPYWSSHFFRLGPRCASWGLLTLGEVASPKGDR